MKLLYLIITLLNFGLIRTSLVSPSNSVFGPCQKPCISRFVESEERVTNIDTTYRVIDVLNNTDFALCRLGCTNPGYSDLNLPSFNYGQSAYTEIRTSKNPSLFRDSVVDSVDILCLDRINEQLIGKVVMVLDDGVDPMESIHLVEIIALDSADVDNSLVFQDFCYNLRCDVSFKFNVSSFTEIRLRITTYDDNAVIGRPILSRRYDLEKALRTEFNNMQLIDVEWNEDKAAARFILDESGNSYIPKCSFQVNFKNTTNSMYESVDMYIDQTREILVKNLNFNQNYTMSLIGDSEKSDDAVEVNVPKCSEMVDDVSMCAPPPVSSISSHWNISTSHDSRLIIDWSYYSVLGESTDDPTDSDTMSCKNANGESSYMGKIVYDNVVKQEASRNIREGSSGGDGGNGGRRPVNYGLIKLPDDAVEEFLIWYIRRFMFNKSTEENYKTWTNWLLQQISFKISGDQQPNLSQQMAWRSFLTSLPFSKYNGYIVCPCCVNVRSREGVVETKSLARHFRDRHCERCYNCLKLKIPRYSTHDCFTECLAPITVKNV